MTPMRYISTRGQAPARDFAGVLLAGKTTFKVDPAILKNVAANSELFARIEKRDDSWWLFNASWVVRTNP